MCEPMYDCSDMDAATDSYVDRIAKLEAQNKSLEWKMDTKYWDSVQAENQRLKEAAPAPDDELARLNDYDRGCAWVLHKMLRDNPWPSGNPRWQLLEHWSGEIIKRTESLVRLKENQHE